MSDKLKRYHEVGLFEKWRLRRAARICGVAVKPWLEKTFGMRQIYSFDNIREAKRVNSLTDREVAVASGFFLNEKDFEEAARRFPFVLDRDDARRLVKAAVPGMTVFEHNIHNPDGQGGDGRWDGGRGS